MTKASGQGELVERLEAEADACERALHDRYPDIELFREAASRIRALEDAVRKITCTPSRPFPDANAHSLRAWGLAVYAAWHDIQRIARAALETKP